MCEIGFPRYCGQGHRPAFFKKGSVSFCSLLEKKKNANGTVGPGLACVKCMEVGQSVGDWSLLA